MTEICFNWQQPKSRLGCDYWHVAIRVLKHFRTSPSQDTSLEAAVGPILGQKLVEGVKAIAYIKLGAIDAMLKRESLLHSLVTRSVIFA